MITLKHAYVNLDNMRYEIKNIIEALEENRQISAYRQLLKLEDNRKTLIKPLYGVLTKKQKDQLLDGWTPDTDGGSYINVKDPSDWKKEWEKHD